MAVIINELEHVPAVEGRTEVRGSRGGEAHEHAGSSAAQQPRVLSVIRREASRQARLWAD